MLVFYFMEWTKVYYNRLETNIEVTRCGRVRRVKTDFYGNHFNSKLGEIDFSTLKLNSDGYKEVGIKINNFKYTNVKVHQLIAAAFLGYIFGKFPDELVMHLDDNPLNNNLSNLKIGNNRENCSQLRTIKSGLPTGVSIGKRGRFYARIRIKKEYLYLGCFNTPEEASNAYQNKLNTLNQ